MVTVLIQCCTLCCLFHLYSTGAESFPSLSVFNSTIGLLSLFAFALESRGVWCQRCPHIRQEIAECTCYFFVGVASTIVSFKVFRPLLQQDKLIITTWTIATLFRPYITNNNQEKKKINRQITFFEIQIYLYMTSSHTYINITNKTKMI